MAGAWWEEDARERQPDRTKTTTKTKLTKTTTARKKQARKTTEDEKEALSEEDEEGGGREEEEEAHGEGEQEQVKKPRSIYKIPVRIVPRYSTNFTHKTMRSRTLISWHPYNKPETVLLKKCKILNLK